MDAVKCVKVAVVLFVLLLISLAVNLAQWQLSRYRYEVSRSERVDSVIKVRKVEEPEPKDEKVLPSVKVKAGVPSGRRRMMEPLSGVMVEVSDSDTLVTVPMAQKVYEDSGYTAYVSGYNVSLDSLVLREKMVTRTITEAYEKKPPDVSVGLVAGYGYGLQSRMMEPFVGIGVTYRVDIASLFKRKRKK